MQPYNLKALYESFSKITKEIVLYLPRSSNLNQLALYVEEGKQAQAIQYCMKGASKVRLGDCIPAERYRTLIVCRHLAFTSAIFQSHWMSNLERPRNRQQSNYE
jgi:RNA cap guanine-N2 methyltransferase